MIPWAKSTTKTVPFQFQIGSAVLAGLTILTDKRLTDHASPSVTIGCTAMRPNNSTCRRTMAIRLQHHMACEQYRPEAQQQPLQRKSTNQTVSHSAIWFFQWLSKLLVLWHGIWCPSFHQR